MMPNQKLFFGAKTVFMTKLEKNIGLIPRKHPDRQQDGRTLFHTTLLAVAGDPTSTTAVDWHLKVKDIIEYDVGLTKNYCITVSMKKSAQFINSFLGYSRLQGLMNLMAKPIFDYAHPKTIEIEITINFPEFI